MADNGNGETKILTHASYWISIMAALIIPYLFHERQLACISKDVAVMKVDITYIRDKMDEHILNDAPPKSVADMKDKIKKYEMMEN